jgi:hypothetical protein
MSRSFRETSSLRYTIAIEHIGGKGMFQTRKLVKTKMETEIHMCNSKQVVHQCCNGSIGCHGFENARLPDADLCEDCQIEAVETHTVDRNHRFDGMFQVVSEEF